MKTTRNVSFLLLVVVLLLFSGEKGLRASPYCDFEGEWHGWQIAYGEDYSLTEFVAYESCSGAENINGSFCVTMCHIACGDWSSGSYATECDVIEGTQGQTDWGISWGNCYCYPVYPRPN